MAHCSSRLELGGGASESPPECVSRRQCGEATWELRPPNGRLLPRSSRAAQSSISPASARRPSATSSPSPRRRYLAQSSSPLYHHVRFCASASPCLLRNTWLPLHTLPLASKRSSQNSRPEQGKPTLFVTSSSHHAGPASHATQHASCISPPRPTQVSRIPSPLSLFAHAMPARRQISQHRRYLHAIASRARRPPPQRMFARPRRVAPAEEMN